MTEQRPWLAAYPPGVPADIDPVAYVSLAELLEQAFETHASKIAFTYMGQDFRFARLAQESLWFAAYLQGLGLVQGDRVAVMMPNVAQYPVAVAGILRAGLVLVNVNPLYTARELEQQLKDSGAKAIVLVENFARTLQTCLLQTDVKHVVLASMGEQLSWLKRHVVNYVVRRVKKMVPPFTLQGAVYFSNALAQGQRARFKRPNLQCDDTALLQYTGGTTGVSKGAVLSHRNVIANVLQAQAWYSPALQGIPVDEQPTKVCALPLYHIFAFTVNLMLGLHLGIKNIMIPNPRDLPATFKALAKHRFHIFPAVNTLFNAIANHPDFDSVDWSNLRLSVGGGMAVQRSVAQLWLEKTGCPICEGYGLSETSPVAACNPVTSREFTGSIGVPLPSTWIKCVDFDGNTLPAGEQGEIAIKGPQVMQGYWQRQDETERAMIRDGFFLTGDIGVMDEQGYIRLVDRKKDMILVSGFNVYPAEIEDVFMQMPGIMEVAAVGIPDDRTGEAVRLVVVRKDPSITAEQIQQFAQENLTAYKCPKQVKFRDELPKTPVGKVLRRQLRDG